MLRPPATRREQLDWLRLIRAENVGPATFAALLARFGDAAGALEALPRLARRGGLGASPRIPSIAEAEREFAALEALGGRFVMRGQPDYPTLLAAAEGAPPILAFRGQSPLLSKPALAVVGARNASAAGLRMARTLSTGLARAGLVIVSGLARGIDTVAHEAALETGTMGVLAGGLDVIYPEENQRLYNAMAERGALLSEMPLGTAPQARHFPRRNRIISGLARAVLVIEAAERSGSLITARFALEQGRDVYAVPGSPLDPRSRGTNKLIREGAALIQDPEDVLEALSHAAPPRLTEPEDLPALAGQSLADMDEEALATARRDILRMLGPTPVEIDELIRLSGAAPAAVQTVLLELELAGRLSRSPGQRVCLVESPD